MNSSSKSRRRCFTHSHSPRVKTTAKAVSAIPTTMLAKIESHIIMSLLPKRPHHTGREIRPQYRFPGTHCLVHTLPMTSALRARSCHPTLSRPPIPQADPPGLESVWVMSSQPIEHQPFSHTYPCDMPFVIYPELQDLKSRLPTPYTSSHGHDKEKRTGDNPAKTQ